jgi:hypothetical protein
MVESTPKLLLVSTVTVLGVPELSPPWQATFAER